MLQIRVCQFANRLLTIFCLFTLDTSQSLKAMSSSIFTPSNRVKLTNVSVVRLKRGGKRFELACYKNKVADYRSGSCRSLSDVLQIEQVFINVHKGELAKKEDITKAFGSEMKQDDIIKFILKEGEVQVSGQEWDKESQSKSKEIAGIVAEKCLNPSTRLPYPPSLIERAMTDVGFAVVPKQDSKGTSLGIDFDLGEEEGISDSEGKDESHHRCTNVIQTGNRGSCKNIVFRDRIH